MTRTQRQRHILKLTADLELCRDLTRAKSRQPLALVKKYPLLALTTSALVTGMMARLLLAAPLSASVKLLGVPAIRALFPMMMNYLVKDSASMRAFIYCQYRAFRDFHR
jgi:uncharacterized membrane protein